MIKYLVVATFALAIAAFLLALWPAVADAPWETPPNNVSIDGYFDWKRDVKTTNFSAGEVYGVRDRQAQHTDEAKQIAQHLNDCFVIIGRIATNAVAPLIGRDYRSVGMRPNYPSEGIVELEMMAGCFD